MKKKAIALLAVICLIFGCFAGCAKKMTVQSIYIDGNYIPVDTLLEIDSNKISLFEYRYYFATMKNTWDEGNDNYWEEDITAFDDLKAYVLHDLQYTCAKYALAQDLGIKLTSENRKNISAQIKELKKTSGTDAAYKQILSDAYLDEALLEKLLERDELSSEIYDYYYGDEGVNYLSFQTVVDYVKENYVHYKQIYVRFDYDDTTTNKDLMESIVKQLDEGADFDVLMKKYTRDLNLSQYPNGYYAEKEAESEFVKTIAALEEGAHSAVIEGNNGYYIFKRLEFDDDVSKNIDTFRSEMEIALLDDIIQEYIDKQNVTIISDYYEKISFDSVLFK